MSVSLLLALGVPAQHPLHAPTDSLPHTVPDAPRDLERLCSAQGSWLLPEPKFPIVAGKVGVGTQRLGRRPACELQPGRPEAGEQDGGVRR